MAIALPATTTRSFLGVSCSVTGRAWRDRLDERGAARALAIAQRHDFSELLARVRALQRRGRQSESDILRVGDLEMHLLRRRVERAGTEIRLTAREFDLLRYLAEHAGRVIGRTRLLEAVWDTMHDPGTNTVDTYISYLRRKVDIVDPRLIQTIRGVGFTLRVES